MYSEMSRDPTAMTFRFPEGDTFWIKTMKKIHQKLEIFFKSQIISYAKLYKRNIRKSLIND